VLSKVMGAYVALVGTVTVTLVAVAAVTVARVAPKNTTLLVGVALKLVPVIVTEVPILPLVGEKLDMVGTCACANPTLSRVKNKCGKPQWYLSFHKNLSIDYLKIDEDRKCSYQKMGELGKLDAELDNY
jgi:hypothetical protein